MSKQDIDFSNTVIDKLTAVTNYGTEAQQNFFKKYKKLNSTNEQGLLSTLEQYYETVEKIRVGRAYHYSLGQKRETVEMRKDARVSNGLNRGNTIEYTKHLDIMVADYIEHRDHKDKGKSKTYKSWLIEMGLMSGQLMDVMNKRNDFVYRDFLFDLYFVNEGIISGESEYHIIDEYFTTVDELALHLKRSLKRLEKAGLIFLEEVYRKKVDRYYPEPENGDDDSPKGKIPESLQNWVTISEEVYFKSKEVDRNLREKYGVTYWQTLNLKNLKQVKDYWKEKNDSTIVEVEENGVVAVEKFQYITYRIIKKTNKDILNECLRVYYPDELESKESNFDDFMEHHTQGFHVNRRKRVSKMLGERIQQKFNDNTKGMEKLGIKRSRLYNPDRFNVIIEKIQDKNIELLIGEMEEEEKYYDEFDDDGY